MGLPSYSQFCQQQWRIFPFCSISSFTEGSEYAAPVTGCSSGISYFLWEPLPIKQMKTDLLNIQRKQTAKIMEWYFCTTEMEKLWTSGNKENKNNKITHALQPVLISLQQPVFIMEVLSWTWWLIHLSLCFHQSNVQLHVYSLLISL